MDESMDTGRKLWFTAKPTKLIVIGITAHIGIAEEN